MGLSKTLSDEKEWRLHCQAGRCRICRAEINGKAAHLDHCHRTGKIRGVLCADCNLGLGRFKDDPELLLQAIRYVRPNWINDRVEEMIQDGEIELGGW